MHALAEERERSQRTLEDLVAEVRGRAADVVDAPVSSAGFSQPAPVRANVDLEFDGETGGASVFGDEGVAELSRVLAEGFQAARASSRKPRSLIPEVATLSELSRYGKLSTLGSDQSLHADHTRNKFILPDTMLHLRSDVSRLSYVDNAASASRIMEIVAIMERLVHGGCSTEQEYDQSLQEAAEKLVQLGRHAIAAKEEWDLMVKMEGDLQARGEQVDQFGMTPVKHFVAVRSNRLYNDAQQSSLPPHHEKYMRGIAADRKLGVGIVRRAFDRAGIEAAFEAGRTSANSSSSGPNGRRGGRGGGRGGQTAARANQGHDVGDDVGSTSTKPSRGGRGGFGRGRGGRGGGNGFYNGRGGELSAAHASPSAPEEASGST